MTSTKIIKNKLTKLIRTAHKQYYVDQFEEIRGYMKCTWQLINNVIHDNFGHSKSSSVDELSCDSSVLTDPVNIANKFNEYFTHICPNLAAKIPQVPGSHLDYVKTNVKRVCLLNRLLSLK